LALLADSTDDQVANLGYVGIDGVGLSLVVLCFLDHALLSLTLGEMTGEGDLLFHDPDRGPESTLDALTLLGGEHLAGKRVPDVTAKLERFLVADLPDRSIAVGTGIRRSLSD